MPTIPFPITAQNQEELNAQVAELIRQLYDQVDDYIVQHGVIGGWTIDATQGFYAGSGSSYIGLNPYTQEIEIGGTNNTPYRIPLFLKATNTPWTSVFDNMITDTLMSGSAIHAGVTCKIPTGSSMAAGTEAIGIKVDNDNPVGESYNGGLSTVIGYDHAGWFATSATITELIGFRSDVVAPFSNITTFKELYLKGITFGPASCTNRFSIYQEDALCNNYFAGNIGIGTTNPGVSPPASPFSVGKVLEIKSDGTTKSAGLLLTRSDGITAGHLWHDGDNWGTYLDSYYNNDVANIYFRTKTAGTPVNAMTILGSGNVGIGATTPQTKVYIGLTGSATNPKTDLTHFGSSGMIYLSNAHDTTDKEVGIFAGTAYSSLSSGIGFARENSSDWGTQIRFYTHGTGITAVTEITERMRITAAGNVGIGTTAPHALLSLGSSVANTKLALYDDSTPNLYGMGIQANEFRFHVYASGADFRFYDAPAGNALVTIKGTGQLGVGTISPATKFDLRDGDFSLTDTDVAHGMTDIASTETYGKFVPISQTAGGMLFIGLTDADTNAMNFRGVSGAASPTAATVVFTGGKKNGTGWQALAAGELLLSVDNYSTAGLLTVKGNGDTKIAAGFGCNTKNPQASYASGGALAAYGAGANGLDSAANMAALHAMVVSIRAALVANGIMS